MTKADGVTKKTKYEEARKDMLLGRHKRKGKFGAGFFDEYEDYGGTRFREGPDIRCSRGGNGPMDGDIGRHER